MKRLVSLVAASLLLGAAFAEEERVGGVTWTYSIEGDAAVVTDFDSIPTSGVLVVPETLGDYPVTGLGDSSLWTRESFTRLEIPASVRFVGACAISGEDLEEIVFKGAKPEFDPEWFDELDPEICVIMVPEGDTSWGPIPGELDGIPIVGSAYSELLTVVFSPEDGTGFDNHLEVTLTSPFEDDEREVSKIYYTLDGSAPTTNAQLYADAIRLTRPTTIRAVLHLWSEGEHFYGPVCSATYTAPQPDGGPYTEMVDDRTWTFRVANRKAYILRASHETPAVPVETDGALELPATLGGRPVAGVDVSAFERCRYLRSVTFPETLESIASFAFKDCLRLTNLVYQGASPTIDLAAFDGAPVPGYGVKPSPTTNAVPVAVDIQGDVVNVPDSWLEELELRFGEGTTNAFVAAYGNVLSNALLKATGKHDLNGNPLYVWQDWVAGTNPVDLNDVLTAWIDVTAEGPVITWTPVLGETEAALRVYAVWGAKKLGAGVEWQDVTALTPAERKAQGWRFFHVTVRMKAE